ncbi:MAG TPA: galactokinase [Gaiellaceae bacterium]|nr:galactokinase [Gaiellaceae bacterium]
MSARAVRSPGRVNLLGEHTDYNDGFVLPVAIDLFTTVRLRPRGDDLVTVEASDLGERDAFRLDAIDRTGTWRDYVRGVVRLLRLRSGAELHIASELPRGAGLSSSAALETAVARALSDLSPRELALLCRRAENEFVGVSCGIMDQFTVANAKAGHALLLDCRDLSFEHIPIPPEIRIMVCDSHVDRRLADSAYNERRDACARAAAGLGVPALRDAGLGQLERLPADLRRVARHVVTENARVLEGAAELSAGNLGAFGALMNESHASLRDDFDVCPPALDTLAAAVRGIPGCYGCRLTGAGFGGCTVALVDRASVADVRRAAQALGASVYDCASVAGVSDVPTGPG